MNSCQPQVLNDITSSIQQQIHGSTDRLKFFITGGAGTGNTFLFNLLKNQVARCYNSEQAEVIKVAALTGVAAKLVGGRTLHSILKLPVQKDGKIERLGLLTGQYLQQMRNEWRNVKFLFIDEVLMIAYEMLCHIDSRLKQLKNNDELFG